MKQLNPLYLADFYKLGHVGQYPSDTEQIWSNWTARKSRRVDGNETVHVGLQYFLMRYLIEDFNENFFGRDIDEIIREYKEFVLATLGIQDAPTKHIRQLWEFGYLPVKFYALPEGTVVPIGVPSLVVTNTRPEAYWVPNFLETIMSNILWVPSTSATTARRYRKIFMDAARAAGETDMSFIDWQGHDFSMRGMGGVEDAVLSGIGHLTQFSGTDTIPSIFTAKDYYGAGFTVGGSVPATEHSVMSAGGHSDELETFRRLLTKVYPSGIVSIVSDTWDLWKVLTEYVPTLKQEILARDGKMVIRPDSGDPVKIICGDGDSVNTNAYSGAATLLCDAMGCTTNPSGYRHINKAGLIYGDAITLDVARDILKGLLKKKIHPFNMVFGIGSYTYRMVTRDTDGYAMKATAVRRGGVVLPIFKNPVTDTGMKKSLRGIPIVERNVDGKLHVWESLDPKDLDNCAFEKVFENSRLLQYSNFGQVRERARQGL